MLNTIKHKIVILLQLLLVITFILFEEIIWEGIAKPIYTYVHSLKVLQKVETKLQETNRFIILSLFLLMFLIVELAGVYAGILFMSGQIMFGLVVYVTKIPVTAFTFWLFRVCEEKLMQFGWFKWIYEKIMQAIAWLKSREVYIETMEKLKAFKEKMKIRYREFKEKYFSDEGPFMMKLKELYTAIKHTLRSSTKPKETPPEANEIKEPKE